MIVGVSVVKNEEDIIEVMVRHNLTYLDKMVIFDNGSADATAQIVRDLASEGLQCELLSAPGVDHRQHEILSNALPQIQKDLEPVHVIPLDADEFIRADREAFRQEMQSPVPITFRWATYVPTKLDNPNTQNPLERIRHRCETETSRAKISVPGKLLGSSKLSRGSHRLFDLNGDRIRAIPSQHADFAHFPIRTTLQLLSKALIGSWSVKFRTGRIRSRGGEARQWHDLAAMALAGVEMGPEELTKAALSYSNSKDASLVEDPITPVPEMKYTPQQDYRWLMRNLIMYTDHLLDEALRQRRGE